MTTAANVQATTVNLDLYVATGVGSDLNPGTSAALPVATYAQALRLIPFEIKHRVIVHMAAGTYLVTSSIGPKAMDAPIFVYGDGGGQAGQDGFTALATDAAIAGSSTLQVVTAGGYTLNQYKGKTIQITSGPANGDRRTIRDNTTTTFTPANAFSAAVAATNTFRIVEPNVILEVALTNTTTPTPSIDSIPLARNCGAGGTSPLNGTTFTPPPPVGVYFCNLRIKTLTADADTLGLAAFINSTVCLFGIELVSDTGKTLRLVADLSSILLSGFDYLNTASAPMSLRPFDNGFATGRRSWSGWGFSTFAGAGSVTLSDIMNLTGYLAHAGNALLGAATWTLMGGSLFSTAVTCIRVTRWTRLFFATTASTPVFLVHHETNTAQSGAFEIFDAGELELGSITIEKQDQGYCVAVYASGSGNGAIPGQVGINSNVTLTGITLNTAPTNAIYCEGGRVDMRTTTLTISGFATGTQLCVNADSGTLIQRCDLADLGGSGRQLPCLPDRMFFLANGLLIGFASAAAPGTFDPAAQIDGCRIISRFSLIDTITMTQVVDGGGGTTTMEIFRRRGGANTSLGTVSIASGGGVFATASLTPASVALRTLNVGDILVAQFNARQTTTAAGVSLELLGGGIDGRYGWIRRL